MSDIAIRCEGLSKQYRIGERESYKALRDVITDGLYAPINWARTTLDGRRKTGDRTNGHRSPVTGQPSGTGPPTSVTGQPSADGLFWALDDVSFEVKRGEVIGIIGRNGAGKSTLLKILSRITKPTKGHAEIHGRVGSLLEVGTGFHPELTGRENIYLNAAILGMRKAEVARKFDEIVAFAEVERFIDTPVKRYSSGMYVRLAFAVAAHMETEVLLVDEVLAVGDMEFQKKCLGKIEGIAKEGRTVLFVSHYMPSLKALCDSGLLLAAGRIERRCGVDEAIKEYLSRRVSSEYVGIPAGHGPSITKATATWDEHEGITLQVSFTSSTQLCPPILGILLHDPAGTPVFGTNPRFDRQGRLPPSMLAGVIEVKILTEYLRPDTYYLSLWLGDYQTDYCHLDRALCVDVGLGSAKALQPPRQFVGSVALKTRWSYQVLAT